MEAGSNQPGVMRHVDHQVRANFLGDLAQAGEVDLARIGRGAGDDELRLGLQRALADGVHVDHLVLIADLVVDDVEPVAGHGDRRAVGEVTAVGEVHAHEAVARLEKREEHRLVRLGARVRLDVGVGGAEELLDAVDGDGLDLVDELAAAVVTLAGVALGVLVGQHRALGDQHVAGNDVLGRDELDLVLLAAELAADGGGDGLVGEAGGGGVEH